MKFLSLLILALPMAAQAAVKCCADTACSDCGSELVEKAQCMDQGSPAILIEHPTEPDQCMQLSQITVDCCYDTKCEACATSDEPGYGTVVEECVLDGWPSYYDINLPGKPEDNCVRTDNERLVDCCEGSTDDFPVNDPLVFCPGTYCECTGCVTRLPLSYCLDNGYRKSACRSTLVPLCDLSLSPILSLKPITPNIITTLVALAFLLYLWMTRTSRPGPASGSITTASVTLS